MKQVAIISPLDDSIPLDLSSFKFFSPRYGSVAVASYLAANGYNARIFCEHSHNPIDWDFVYASDYIAFSVLSFCAYRTYEMIDRIRAKTRVPIIIGGNHASVQPEDAALHADFVVRREGEAIVLELLQTLDHGGDISTVAGISYRKPDGSIVHNPDREFMEDLSVVADFSLVPGFGPVTWKRRFLDILRNGMPHENLPFIMASRGCPYHCRFCFTRRELGGRHRRREADCVIEEIKRTAALTRSRTMWFADADLLINRNYSIELLRKMASSLDGRTDFIAFCRADVAEDEEMQSLLKAAYVKTLCIGAESVNKKTLAQFGKELQPDILANRVRKLRSAGFDVFASFIFGGEDDVSQCINEAVDFAVDAGVKGMGLHPLYDFPNQKRVFGTDQVIEDERFIHHDWRFFSGNFVVFFPKRVRPSELQSAIREGHLRFYQKQKEALFEYRPVFLTYEKYIPFLRREEQNLYTPDGELILGRLRERDPSSIKKIPVDFRGIQTYPYALSVLARNLFRPASWKTLMKYTVRSVSIAE